MPRLRLGTILDVWVVLGVAALFAFFVAHWEQADVAFLLVSLVGIPCLAILVRREEKRAHLEAMTLAAALRVGSSISGWIENDRPVDPMRQVFEELKMAEAVWQWNERAKQVVSLACGKRSVAQFEHAGKRQPPSTLSPNVASYWETLNARLDWLSQQIDRRP
jgi:hypothetical protein